MKAIDLRIQEAHDKADEWVTFLATYPDRRLEKRLDAIRKQQVIAQQNKDEKGFELLLLWEHITISARIYKEEHNIPDAIDEMAGELKNIETVVVLSEKRKVVYTTQPKENKPKTSQEDNSNQTSLF